MSEQEVRALRRAAVILLLASTARWAWSHRTPPVPLQGDAAVPALLAASQSKLTEERARSRPLTTGERIDPNRASEVDLDRLPGIGPATARAIVASRDAEGPFRRPGDLERVRGIGPSTVDRLRERLDLAQPPSGRSAGGAAVDLNRAGEVELQRLPGVGPALARRIVEERRKAPFASLEDLVRVRGIGPATVARLRGQAVARR